MAETILIPGPQVASPIQVSKDILINGNDLSNQLLNQVIIAAATKRAPMTFAVNGTVQTHNTFTINPSRVSRTAKAVEAEFPTMAAWHTYRWMIEPAIWQITGYAGFLGPFLLQNIIDLDGQDNITWSYPYVFSNPRTVKILNSMVQHDSPFSTHYQITMRELPAVVRNYVPAGVPPFNTSNVFVSPNLDPTNPSYSLGTLTIEDLPLHDLTGVATYVTQRIATNITFKDQFAALEANNALVSESWSNAPGPTDKNTGKILTELTYRAS